MDKELVLLSDSLYGFLKDVWNETNNQIIFELLYSQDLINEYNSTKDEILQTKLKTSINDHLTDYARMLSFRNNEFVISFLPKGKEPKYSGEKIWSRENRQSGKPTKILQKIVKRKFTNRDYELLNNLLKSKILNQKEFEVVEGKDIQYWYNEVNNDEGATLSNSCMRYADCSQYLELYADVCKMLVLFNEDKSLICGRALLWEIDDKIYMDRVYYSRDWYYDLFIDYAQEHKFAYRANNSLLSTGSNQYWYSPQNNYKSPIFLSLHVELPKSYDRLPYIDSFRYLFDDILYDHLPTSDELNYLEEIDACDCADGETSKLLYITCYSCGKSAWNVEGEENSLYWSDHDGRYYCDDCCSWVEVLEDYIHNDDIVDCVDEDDYSFIDARWDIERDSNYIKHEGTYYHINSEYAQENLV